MLVYIVVASDTDDADTECIIQEVFASEAAAAQWIAANREHIPYEYVAILERRLEGRAPEVWVVEMANRIVEIAGRQVLPWHPVDVALTLRAARHACAAWRTKDPDDTFRIRPYRPAWRLDGDDDDADDQSGKPAR
jgi:hypothetical protein